MATSISIKFDESTNPRWFYALLVTVFLFLVMKLMILGKDYAIEKEKENIKINFMRLERDEDVNEKQRIKRPTREESEPPPPPPQLDQLEKPDLDDAVPDADFGFGDGFGLNAPVDGDALAIVRILPRYPSHALSRGIEGWVLLEFTISELGLAINPVVVDSEPRGVFDRSAISAVRKWKYRPKMEDGKAVKRPNVRQLISFTISKTNDNRR